MRKISLPRIRAVQAGKDAVAAEAAAAGLLDLQSHYVVETLADRIKRAKRTATSSSDHDGPTSHGGSADRHHGPGTHGAAHGGAAGAHHAAGSDAAGPPHAHPVPQHQLPRGEELSGEAQSRGADAPPPCAGARETTWTTGAGGGLAGPGGNSASVKQQQAAKAATAKDEGVGSGSHKTQDARHPAAELNAVANLRGSAGGAQTDSSGGGAGPAVAAQRALNGSGAGKGASATPGLSPSVAAPLPPNGMKRMADFPSRNRGSGGGAPPAKMARTDPQLPRPATTGQDRRSGGGAPPASSELPASKLAAGQRSTSGPVAVKPEPGSGVGEGAGGGGGRTGTGPSPPSRRTAEVEPLPAAGSYKGKLGGGGGGASRGSKDGGGDRGASGPRGAGAEGGAGNGAAGGGNAAAAATTTTEPKTDSDTRTSRVVECFFDLDQPPRAGVVPGVSASLSGLGSTGSRLGAAAAGGGNGFSCHKAHAAGGGGEGGGAAAAPQLLDLAKVRSFKDLWVQLAALYEGTLPDEIDSKLIYLVSVAGERNAEHVCARFPKGNTIQPGVGCSGACKCAGCLGSSCPGSDPLRTCVCAVKSHKGKGLINTCVRLCARAPAQQDEDGDWIMVTPDEPWASVSSAATKVLITNRT